MIMYIIFFQNAINVYQNWNDITDDIFNTEEDDQQKWKINWNKKDKEEQLFVYTSAKDYSSKERGGWERSRTVIS
jgi:hypothetical protein